MNSDANAAGSANPPNGRAGRIDCEEKNVRMDWLVQIFSWIDRLGDLWITKLKLPCKDLLVPVSCGASFFEQAVGDFDRIDSYSIGQQATGQGAAPSLPVCPATAEYKEKVRSILKNFEEKFAKKELTWDDYYELQTLMLPLYPEQELRGKHAKLRDQFNLRAPQHFIAMYEKSAPPVLGGNTAYADILGDALYLQRELATIDTYRPHQELKRNTITFELFVSLVVVIFLELAAGLIVWGYLWWRHFVTHSGNVAFPFIVIVMMLGALGATVSSQRRLQDSFDEDSSILNSTRYVGSGVGTKLAPFQGSVFAAVLLFVLYSGLINTVLPSVTKPPSTVGAGAAPPISASPTSAASVKTNTVSKAPNKTTPAAATAMNANAVSTSPVAAPISPTLAAPSAARTVAPTATMSPPSNKTTATEKTPQNSNAGLISRAMLFLFGPEDTIEYAKILVYAFLAGFAERLVPDTLDRLTRGKT